MILGFGFRGIVRFCSGLWGYLTAKADGRAAVALERERNFGTVEAIKALPPGAELLENELNGRFRLIRIPGTQSSVVPMPKIQLPAIEQPVISLQHPLGLAPGNGELSE